MFRLFARTSNSIIFNVIRYGKLVYEQYKFNLKTFTSWYCVLKLPPGALKKKKQNVLSSASSVNLNPSCGIFSRASIWTSTSYIRVLYYFNLKTTRFTFIYARVLYDMRRASWALNSCRSAGRNEIKKTPHSSRIPVCDVTFASVVSSKHLRGIQHVVS